jgi:hypothetical protein
MILSRELDNFIFSDLKILGEDLKIWGFWRILRVFFVTRMHKTFELRCNKEDKLLEKQRVSGGWNPTHPNHKVLGVRL